jgi:hypothetical protein
VRLLVRIWSSPRAQRHGHSVEGCRFSPVVAIGHQ